MQGRGRERPAAVEMHDMAAPMETHMEVTRDRQTAAEAEFKEQAMAYYNEQMAALARFRSEMNKDKSLAPHTAALNAQLTAFEQALRLFKADADKPATCNKKKLEEHQQRIEKAASAVHDTFNKSHPSVKNRLQEPMKNFIDTTQKSAKVFAAMFFLAAVLAVVPGAFIIIPAIAAIAAIAAATIACSLLKNTAQAIAGPSTDASSTKAERRTLPPLGRLPDSTDENQDPTSTKTNGPGGPD